MKKKLLLAATIFCFLNLTNAQPGQLDPSFGTNGIVKTDIGAKFPYTRFVRQMLSLPDESMYVVEEFKGLSKRRPNGSLDSSFGLNGYAPYYVSSAALQPDGKIVTIGAGGLGRYNTNGQLDSSFSGDGKQATDLNMYAVAIQKDGRIVVAGSGISNNYLSLARYNAAGSPDNTFDGDGMVKSDLSYNANLDYTTAIALQSDGKIVVAGGFSMVRFNFDGTTDKTFDGNGIHAFKAFNSLAIQKDGKIATIGLEINVDQEGSIDISQTICRLNTDGSFDNSFSDDGKQPATYGTTSLALQNDEKIVTVASVPVKHENGNYFEDFIVTRYNTDGSLDKSFDNDGMQTTGFDNGASSAPQTVTIQSNGKIVVGGSTYFTEVIAIARYNTNGSLDKTFDEDGKLIDNSRVGRTVYKNTAIQKDGKIVVAGSTYSGLSSEDNLVIARYNTDGSLDNTFNKNGILITAITSVGDYAINVAVQSDGKIIAASEDAHILVRYNTDGSLDNSFNYDNNNRQRSIRSLAIQSDGKIVVEGYTYNATYGTFEIRRYNTDGSVDKAFGKDGISGQYGIEIVVFYDKDGGTMEGYTSSIAIQNDGKIVVGGVASRDYPYGNSFIALARLNTNGSLDNTFSNDGKAGFPLVGATSSLLAIQDDGKIVIGGDFADLSSRDGVSLKRFNTDGSIDSSFNGKTPLNHAIFSTQRTSIALQSDGKIVLAGSDLLRFNTNGGLDSTFDINAGQKVDFYINNIVISDNKIYAAGGGLYGTVARYLLDGNNTPPTVSLTAPANNATYLAPAAHIKLSAAAADKDGTITKVEFYKGKTLLHTETVFPYGFVWRNVPLGNYTLTAKATDNNGLVTISAAIHISVVPNKAPVVSIVKPSNNRNFAAPAYIHFEAAASDADGRITRVQFYNGSTLLRTEYSSPYTYVWKNIPAGSYTITAVATDNWGAQTTSAPVIVNVTNAMIVSSKPFAENDKTALNDALHLKVYPNPATDVINIAASGLQQDRQTTISVISAAGIMMKTVQIKSLIPVQLNVSTLASGVYTIKLLSGDKIMYKQFVKL